MAFITADAYVYFEPMVYTYDPVNIEETCATLRGYVLAGSDDIIEQGFQYWVLPEGNASARKVLAKAPENNVHTVLAQGQVMQALLSGLRPSTEYGYRAFARCASGDTYGPELTFTTKGTSGIEDIYQEYPAETFREVIGYWDLKGSRHEVPVQGFNIVRYSDGTAEKIFLTK